MQLDGLAINGLATNGNGVDVNRKRNKQDEVKPKRGTRFVPAEDVPSPGLSQRTREVVALALCGFSLYAMLSLATFRLAELDGPPPTGSMQNLGGAVGYYLAAGFTRSLGLAGWVPFLLLLGSRLGPARLRPRLRSFAPCPGPTLSRTPETGPRTPR